MIRKTILLLIGQLALNLLVFSLLVGQAAAQQPFPTDQIVIPTTPITSPGQAPVTLIEIMKLVTVVGNFLIIVAPVIMVIALIVSAILYMTAGDSDRVNKAKEWFRYSIIGGFIVFGSGVIINTIAIIISRQFFCQAGISLNIFGTDLSKCFIR